MPHERDGHRRNARAEAISFPAGEETRDAHPSHADASHIARRRVSSAPAHEVDLDEVELLDEEVPAPPLEQPPTPTSTPPLALDVVRTGAPFRVPLASPLLRRRPPLAIMIALVGSGVALIFVVLGGLALRSSPRRAASHGASAEAVAPPATTPTPTPSAAPLPSPPVVPVVKVSDLPHSPLGVVVGSQGHRLWIDGILAESWRAEVRCGQHVVQVGSAGSPRTVDVRCGEELIVSP